ncbi:hypothetical protein M0802_003163 [Mischocyttarus mexicanus]|nr:hypothetical protein M0802_003163 [Mischocyttarus mexicanus]
MLQIAIVIVALAVASVDLSTAEDVADLSDSNLDVPAAAMKLNKNLRRALLKALTDLEAESVEQRKNNDESLIAQAYTANQFQDVSKKDLSNKIGGISQKSSFSFDGFPGDDEIIPSEDKLQNSSFVQTDKYVIMSSSPSMTIEKATKNDARSFHVQNVIMSDKNNQGPKIEQLMETKKPNGDSYVSYVNKIDSITLKPLTQLTEGLTGASSNGITLENSLPLPKPTVSSPTDSPKINDTLTNGNKIIEKSEEVKIFQAPLVAAFTVQQDESGAPKSVVPIFKPTGDGQALTLQEQLEFKQRLLEKQLEELQQQQLQQTQFLIRQRHLYEQQIRQKQQQQYYIQEHARFKQIEEQNKLKLLEEQRLKQFEEQRLKQFEEQRLKQFDDPRIFRFQQQSIPLQQQQQQQVVPLQQQKYRFFEQATNLLNIPTPAESNVRLQPSVSQEAFNSVGNFGFNEKQPSLPGRNTFTFGVPQRNPINFVYNPYTQNQYRQTRPQQTPAKQIQHLLYQSGIAGELGNAEGSGGQEDLNIVSKVLALNVGAIPNKNLHFTTNNRINNGFVAKVPANA